MALFRCIKDNFYDGIQGYRVGEISSFPSNPNAALFESISDEEANAIEVDTTPLPAWKDLQGDWHVDADVEFENNVEFETLIAQSIELNTAGPIKPWKAGQIQFNPDTYALMADTSIENVRYNYGEELWYPACNNTGDVLLNGTVVYATGVSPTKNELLIDKAIANNPMSSLQTLGFVTNDIADGECGKVTYFGNVGGLNTDSYASEGGVLWLSADVAGEATQTKPTVGNQLVLLGSLLKKDATDGQIWATINITANSVPSYKSETFSSRGVGAGTYYLFGDYLAPTTDVTLSNASLSQALGTANAAYGMRPFAVFAGDGTVDTGQVGLRWISTSITDGGVRVTGDVQIITEDITAPLLNDYIDTPKKVIGAGIYELYVVSGSPTAYSVSFNYGLIKYEDFGNRDFVLTDVEITGLAGASDTSFQLILQKQSVDGWTYSAAGFSPGNGVITSMSSVYVLEDNVINGEAFHFKLDSTAIGDVILGSGSEGIMVKLVTTQNNTIQYLNCHIGASF